KKAEDAVAPAAEGAPAPAEAEAPKKKRVVRKKGEELATEAEAPVLVEVKAEAKTEGAKGDGKVAEGAAPGSEGTLHRPVLKPGEKEKDKKAPKRAAKPSAWVDDVARRRAMKT